MYETMRLWLATAFLISTVFAADVFRTCNDETFCATFRSQVLDADSQFYANVTAAERILNTAHVPLINGNGEKLTLQVSILFYHRMRVKVLEDVQRRYIIRNIVHLSYEDYPPILAITDDTVTVTTEWAVEDKIVVRRGPPFTVEFYLQDKLEMVLNGDRLVMKNAETIVDQAFSFTMEFEEATKLYGLGHHSFQLSLKDTTDGSSEPFRLKNMPKGEFGTDSALALYSSVATVYGHSTSHTSGAFLYNGAQMFVDVSYTGARPSAYFMVECGDFDIFVFLGPNPRDVVRQYTHTTGTTRMPQLWTFGYHLHRDIFWSQEHVTDVVANMDAINFPLDVVYLDGGYTDSNKNFLWNPENFTDPQAMQKNLSATNRRIITVLNPHLLADIDYDVYVSGKELDFYVKNEDGSDFRDISKPGESVWIDFSNPDTRSWYGSQLYFTNFAGSTETIAGICQDMNQPSIYNDTTERTFPPNAVHYDQIYDREIHNLYGFFNAMGADAGMSIRDSYKKRVFVISSSYSAGTQKYSTVCIQENGADWSHIRNSISECVTLNLLGIVGCGTNIGGTYGETTEELLQRWYQMGIWLPYFKAYSRLDNLREPYEYPEAVQAVLRLAIRTRYKHIPYWYRLMYDHTQSGDPLIRPLFYSYPEYVDHDDHLLLGEDILSRPVLESAATQVQVSFPGDGIWYRIDDDSWDIYEGGTEKSVSVNISTSPYFYRGGSIIPRMDIERSSTDQMRTDPFQLYVTLDANDNAEGRLYFDDYTSLEYRTKISYFYSRLVYDFGTNGIWFENIQGDATGFNARIQRIIVHRQGQNKETITTSYTTTSDGIPLEDIDIVQQHFLRRSERGFVMYL